jgi:hypothetical protein
MSDFKEIEEPSNSIPSFFVRWFIFFRLHPSSFLQPRYLFSVLFMSRRHPVLWNNVMEAEKRRIARKKEKEEIRNLTL